MKGKFYLIALLVWIVDFLTKWAISTSTSLGAGWDLIPGYLRISYVRNTGVAFGLFHDAQSAWKPYLLAALAVVAVGLIVVYSLRIPEDRVLLRIALAITLGGILGNFLDRLVRGYVVDFIEVHLREAFYWPTFNVADSAITVGIGLLLIDTVKNPEHREEPEAPV